MTSYMRPPTQRMPGEGFYTQIPNHWIRDHRMPALAFKLMAFWHSHAPGYEVSPKQSMAEVGVGRDALKTAVRWLVEHDYLVRWQLRAGAGATGSGGAGRFDVMLYKLGPAAFEPQYVRAWGQTNVSAGQAADGIPPTDSAGNVSAGQAADGLAVDGSTVDGGSDTKEEQRSKEKQPPPPPPAIVHVPAPRPARPDGGGGDDLLNPDHGGSSWTEAGRVVLARVQDASDVGRRRLRGTPAAVLAAAIGHRLAAGWSEDDAVMALTGSFARADNVAATMTWRVQHLLAGPPPEGAGNGSRTSPAAALPPWCGACDRTDYRWREDGQGRPYRCPECHPAEVGHARLRSSA